jgi:hypothetical protein
MSVELSGRRTRKKFRFKNKLVSLDACVIDLSLSLFDWAQFRRTKGAVKLHLLLDHDGYLPSFAVVTNGKTSDINVACRLRFERGTVVVMDRGYMQNAETLGKATANMAQRDRGIGQHRQSHAENQ